MLDRLAASPGFDLAAALATVCGKTAIYRALLEKYLVHHGNSAREISLALRANDLARARQLVHTLKGTAATLGLAATRAAALDLEQASKQTPPDAAALHRLGDALESTHAGQLAVIRAALAEADPASAPPHA